MDSFHFNFLRLELILKRNISFRRQPFFVQLQRGFLKCIKSKKIIYSFFQGPAVGVGGSGAREVEGPGGIL